MDTTSWASVPEASPVPYVIENCSVDVSAVELDEALYKVVVLTQPEHGLVASTKSALPVVFEKSPVSMSTSPDSYMDCEPVSKMTE